MSASRWAAVEAGPLRLALAALVVAASAAHVPLLRRFFPAVGCPVARDAQSLEAGRAAAVAPLRGDGKAPHRTFVGYTLGRTPPEALPAACVWEIPRGLARCPAAGMLTVRFDGRAMVGLDRQSERLPIVDALRDFSERKQALVTSLGAAHEMSGAVDREALARPYAQTSIRYRFRDVAVELSVTNLGDGLVVREQYFDLAPTGDPHG